MHRKAHVLAGAVVLLTSTGCGIKMLKPLVAGFDDAYQQQCVEAALRGDPDSASLPGAFDRFTRGCDAADPAACSALGVMYEMGHEVKRDHRRAFELYDAACKAGNDNACVNLGLAYVNGIGTKINTKNAAALFKMGCDGKNDRGCTELATMHALGIGVDKSPQRAAELFQVSCHNGDAESCYRLAGMFDEGTLGPDPSRTLSLFEMACAFGQTRACKRVNELYAQIRQTRPRHPDERCPQGTSCGATGVAASR